MTISTQWWDFAPIVAGICGHQHATTYVWGWRYNGNSWSREFVTAHQRTSYENEQGICTFQAEGNPELPPPFDSFAFGPDIIHIPNSPYAVLWTKTQARSHYNAGCGQFECFHPVRVRATYLGGPGVNEGEPAQPQPTNELAIENTPVVEFDPNASLQGPTESLQRGLKLDLESNVRATTFYDSDAGAVVDGKRMVD